jgi:pimeloyl-ACP methyl ester carboxylesterase
MTVPTAMGTAIRRAATAATRAAAGLRVRTTVIDGLRVTYDIRAEGSDPPIVMLHGFSADRDVWGRFALHLRGHRVVIPDLAGHGRTPFRPGGGYSAPAQAGRVIALLDALGIARAHLVGNSMGGFVAATLARLAPMRVASVALIDPAGVTSPHPSPLVKMLTGGHNPFLFEDRCGFEPFYAMTMRKPPPLPRTVRRAIAEDYVARRAQLAEIFEDFYDSDQLDDHLAEISVPAWVVWGRHDQLIDVSAARVWADGLPHATLTVYDDLGHVPMLEAPRRTSRDYRAFLARVDASPERPSRAPTSSPPGSVAEKHSTGL